MIWLRNRCKRLWNSFSNDQQPEMSCHGEQLI